MIWYVRLTARVLTIVSIFCKDSGQENLLERCDSYPEMCNTKILRRREERKAWMVITMTSSGKATAWKKKYETGQNVTLEYLGMLW